MPNLKQLVQIAKMLRETHPSLSRMNKRIAFNEERARETLKESLSKQVRPEILNQVLNSAHIPMAEADYVIRKEISPWTIRSNFPENTTIDELVTFGKQNIKPSEADKFEFPVEDLWKYREYDRLGADAWKLPEEVQKLKDSIQKEGIKEPLSLTVGTPTRPVTKGQGAVPVDAKLDEGNHRLALAKALGIKKVPVVVRGLAGAGVIGEALQSQQPETEEERWNRTMSVLGRK